jgi:hypothetical protein
VMVMTNDPADSSENRPTCHVTILLQIATRRLSDDEPDGSVTNQLFKP